MHAALLPVLAACARAQKIALSTGLQAELASTSLQKCLRDGAGQARELAGPQGAFSQEIMRMWHGFAAPAVHPALECHSFAVSLLVARPGTCDAPNIDARGTISQRLYSDKAISTAKMPCALQPISDLPAMCAGQIWPHVSVVLSNIGQDRLPGLLQQHKPKWMAEVKLHRFCLGDKPPSITSAKVGASMHALLCEVARILSRTSGSIIAKGSRWHETASTNKMRPASASWPPSARFCQAATLLS